MTMTRPLNAPGTILGVDREELIDRMRARQAAKRAQGARLTVGGLIARLESYTAHEAGNAAPPAFWISADDSRAIDRLTAAAQTLTGRSDTAALRELVESVAGLHKMRPQDVLTLRVQDAVQLVA